MQTATYRYHLPRKAIKSDCPQCSPKHLKTLSRYVDSQTGETLPEQFGRCDRESNCGYYLSPYAKSESGISYADEESGTGSIPREWFKMAAKSKRNHVKQESIISTLIRMAGATPQQAEQVVKYVFSRSVLSTPVKSSPVYLIPDEVFTKSLGQYDQNQFALLLEGHFGISAAHELLQRFQIGTSTRWPGACVFWLIDDQGRKRGGQIKLFDKDFKTVRYVDRNGEKRSKTSWVHSALKYRLVNAGMPVPDWLNEYSEKAEFAPCLFGLSQLVNEPTNKPIAIVEAPKTAILCTPYFPQFIWLAAVGRSYLTIERLVPLKGRSIVLFPDLSVQGKDYAYWKGKADNFRQQGFNVVVSDRLERIGTDEQRSKGYDLADYLLNEWKGYPVAWDSTNIRSELTITTSVNYLLTEVLARCLNVPVDAIPLYQLSGP